MGVARRAVRDDVWVAAGGDGPGPAHPAARVRSERAPHATKGVSAPLLRDLGLASLRCCTSAVPGGGYCYRGLKTLRGHQDINFLLSCQFLLLLIILFPLSNIRTPV